jgi:hypothetical protein
MAVLAPGVLAPSIMAALAVDWPARAPQVTAVNNNQCLIISFFERTTWEIQVAN